MPPWTRGASRELRLLERLLAQPGRVKRHRAAADAACCLGRRRAPRSARMAFQRSVAPGM